MKQTLLTLALFVAATLGWAATFETTTIGNDGKVAANTKWYVLTISNSRLVIGQPTSDNFIALNTPLKTAALDDTQQWCFVGTAAQGYTLYNKAAGTKMPLSAPNNLSDDTGGRAFLTLKAEGTANFSQKWDVAAYTAGGATFENPLLLRIHGQAANNVNNRGGKLAFWTTGVDQGSAVSILPVEEAVAIKGNNKQQYLFVTAKGQTPYRIPAIAQAKNGNLIAISDYRPCGADIGYGEVDIKARISKDNGKSWGREFTIADGTGKSGTIDCGFGDAAVVADRESNEVLLICVSGHTTYQSAKYTAGNPNPVARFRSKDGGETWSKFENITEQIYSPYKASKHGVVESLFFGSGKICQSARFKVGTHYRLYAALCARPNGNRVIYSDDFGETWHALGGIDALPARGGDEPKVEELPNGDVVLSSRVSGGRIFNIYKYSDVKTADGKWGSEVNTANVANSVNVQGNSTNGEILIVPAVRKADGAKVFVALQSVPFGNGRANVGIFYKALSEADYASPAAFAATWEGRKQVSTMGSAYSTMCMQQDGKLAFYYEESSLGADYTEVYEPFTLEEITDGKYSFDNIDLVAQQTAELKKRVEDFIAGSASGSHTLVGQALPEGRQAVEKAWQQYQQAPELYDNRIALLAALSEGCLQMEDSVIYRLVNVETNTEIVPSTEGLTILAGGGEATAMGEWMMRYNALRKAWRMVNVSDQSFVRSSSSEGVNVQRSLAISGAGMFEVESSLQGISTIRTAVSNVRAPYLALKNGKLVGTADNTQPAAQWRIEKLRAAVTGIALPHRAASTDAAVCYDLSGKRIAPQQKGIQITADGKKIWVK